MEPSSHGKFLGLQSEACYIWEGTGPSFYLLVGWLDSEDTSESAGSQGGVLQGALVSPRGTQQAPGSGSSCPHPGEWDVGPWKRLH